jgi:hypothetical protein
MAWIRCLVLQGFDVVSLILDKLQESKLPIRATRLSKEDVDRYISMLVWCWQHKTLAFGWLLQNYRCWLIIDARRSGIAQSCVIFIVNSITSWPPPTRNKQEGGENVWVRKTRKGSHW